jgi:hypothetical protein
VKNFSGSNKIDNYDRRINANKKEKYNMKNFCTPFHMKICNSQNSFGGGTTK